MQLRKWIAVSMAWLVLSPLGMAYAAEANVPRATGIVDQAPSKASPTMTVSDVVYNVAKGIVVHASATRTVPLSLVRVKQKIEFTTTGEGPGSRGTITEIWLK
jgi:hypothetical protein